MPNSSKTWFWKSRARKGVLRIDIDENEIKRRGKKANAQDNSTQKGGELNNGENVGSSF